MVGRCNLDSFGWHLWHGHLVTSLPCKPMHTSRGSRPEVCACRRPYLMKAQSYVVALCFQTLDDRKTTGGHGFARKTHETVGVWYLVCFVVNETKKYHTPTVYSHTWYAADVVGSGTFSTSRMLLVPASRTCIWLAPSAQGSHSKAEMPTVNWATCPGPSILPGCLGLPATVETSPVIEIRIITYPLHPTIKVCAAYMEASWALLLVNLGNAVQSWLGLIKHNEKCPLVGMAFNHHFIGFIYGCRWSQLYGQFLLRFVSPT